MKSRVIGKKLALNKETIADLKTGQMKEVNGGQGQTEPATPPIGCTGTCVACPTECTCGTINNICPCASKD